MKQSWFFEKISKINKPIIKLIKKREKTQINNLKMKKVTLQSIPLKSRRWLGNILKNICCDNLENLDKVDEFLDTYGFPSLKQDDTNNLILWMVNDKIDTVIKNTSQKGKTENHMGSLLNSTRLLKKN
jgi:hypothetical protein